VKANALILSLFTAFALQAQSGFVNAMAGRIHGLPTRTEKIDLTARLTDSLEGNQRYDLAFKLLKELEKKYAQALTDSFTPDIYNQLGNFYNSTANYNRAIENFLRSAEIYGKQKRPRGLCNVYTNLGNSYYYLSNYDKALDYYKQSLTLNDEAVHDEEVSSNIYNNIGIIYSLRKNFLMGQNFFNKALQLYLKSGDSLSVAHGYNNFGNILLEQGQVDSAFTYFILALRLKEKFGEATDMIDGYRNIADMYQKKGDIPNALLFGQKALALQDTAFYTANLQETYKLLSEVYEKKNNLPLSLKYYRKSINVRDTIEARNRAGELLQKEISIEVSKVHIADSLVMAEETRVRSLELAQKKRENTYLVISLCIAGLIAVLLYNRFRVTRRQKHIIAGQKILVEQKQKEVLDSIHYAKRIQQSLLTSEKYIERILNRLSKKK